VEEDDQSRLADTVDISADVLALVRSLEKCFQTEISFILTFPFSYFFFDFSHILPGPFFDHLRKMKILISEIHRVPGSKIKVRVSGDALVE